MLFLVSISLWLISCSRERASNEQMAIRHDSTAIESSSPQTAQASLSQLLTYEQRQGKFLFTKYCAVCHGEEGKGDGFNAFNLEPKPRDFTDEKIMNNLTDERITQTILGGGRSVNRSALMPSWGGRIPKEEIRYLVAYVRMFSSPKQSAEAK